MRFLFLTQYYPPEIGAPQVRLAALVRHLTGAGHDVEVITALPNYPTGRISDGYRGRLIHNEVLEGVVVRRVWMYASSGRGLKRLVGYLSFTLMSSFLLLRSRRVDWIFVESPPLTLTVPALLWAKLRKVRSIVNVADLWPDAIVDVGAFNGESLAVRILRRMESWAYRNATVVNSVTDGITATLEQRTDRACVRFLPNGVDTELFRPDGGDETVVEALGLPSEKLLVYTGNIGISQGLDGVVKAMEIVAESDPDIVLALIGDGSARSELERSVEQLGLTNVVFIDPVPVETIAKILPLASVALVSLAYLPTNLGARPSKMFPAMSSGTPIVFAGHSEGADLVVGAGAGLRVANDAPSAIADAVLKIVNDADAAREMGANGRAYVVAEFSWGPIAERWIASLPA